MAATENQLPPSVRTSSPPRIPLLVQTNSPSFSSSPVISKQVRRKTPFIRRIDSSEEVPSSHDSIFTAEYLSNSTSEDSGQKPEPWAARTLATLAGLVASLAAENDTHADPEPSEVRGPAPTPPSIPSITSYVHGTPLPTIIEQSSVPTLRTRSETDLSHLSLSLHNIPRPQLLNHRDSFDLPINISKRSPQRRMSFSADDLDHIKQSYQQSCKSNEIPVRKTLPVHEIYAQPRAPLIPPLQRPPTPDGMPSWTAAQNGAPSLGSARGQRQRRAMLRQYPSRLQRFLGFGRRAPPNGAAGSSGGRPASAASGLRGHTRATSEPSQLRRVPRFRAPRSGYGIGPSANHPFMRGGPLPAAKGVTDSSSIPTSSGAVTNEAAVFGLSRRHSQPSHVISTKAKAKQKTRKEVRFTTSAGGRGQRQPPLRQRQDDRGHLSGSRNSKHEKRQSCPHRRGRRAALKNLNTAITSASHADTYNSVISAANPGAAAGSVQSAPYSQSAPSNDNGQVIPVRSSSRKGTRAGAQVHAQSQSRCWKCRVAKVTERIDGFWKASTRWCCWWCCGVDMTDDDGDDAGAHLVNGVYVRAGMGVPESEVRLLGERSAVLAATPVVLF